MDPDCLFHDERDSVSALRPFCSPTCLSPSLRCHAAVSKQDFGRLNSNITKGAIPEPSVHSQSQIFAPSPLDTIPPSLYTRFPRFSTTTEKLTPDLSTEEVTSTKLSLDEQDIVRAPQSTRTSAEADRKFQRWNMALHKVVSTPSLSLRHVRDRLRRAPSSTLSGKTLEQEATITSKEQYQVCG
jgi:hypothetical protein